MHSLAKAGFALPSVYIEFRLFLLSKGGLIQFSALPKQAEECVGFLATRPVAPPCTAPPPPEADFSSAWNPVGGLFCEVLPRRAAPPCTAPIRTTHGMSGFWTPRVIPGHALHQKGLQRPKRFGPLVSSQEKTALAFLFINQLSTGCQPQGNCWSTADSVPLTVYIKFRLFVLLGARYFDDFEGTEDFCFLGQ